MPARTSRLLIAEPPLQVLPSLAVLIGLNEALFLQQLHYWLGQSGKERDGRLWIYNTYEDWLGQFPFWSKATLRRVVGSLEDSGLVISSSAYNQSKIDRTKWYTIDYDRLDQMSEPADHVLNLSTSTAQDEHMDERNLSSSNQRLSRDNQQIGLSKGTQPRRLIPERERQTIEAFAQDFAREFRDEAKLPSTVTRLTNLYSASGLDMDSFLDTMQSARELTQKHSAGIRKEAADGSGLKSKMGYWFSVVEDQIEKRRGA